MARGSRSNGSNGLGVDRFGGSVIDPTKNVETALASQKDYFLGLRVADEKLADERNRHTEFVAKLRAAHQKELRESDNERLASQRREDQATALADKTSVLGSVQTLAVTTESIRLQLEKRVADSAETLAKATAEGNKATEIRVSALEKLAFTGAGEKAVSDPAMVLLAQSVAELVKITQGTGGERRGNDRVWAALAIGVTILISFGSLAIAVLLSIK